MQKPEDISTNKLANIPDTSRKNIDEILKTIEKTKLIFHIGPFGSITARSKKSLEYYFSTSQIKTGISQESGQVFESFNDFIGGISENIVSSSLIKLNEKQDIISEYSMILRIRVLISYCKIYLEITYLWRRDMVKRIKDK